jgi:threonine/homoserine/homoserine lactone efflux protein
MPETSTFLLFAVSSLAILALPGPTMIYVVARTLEHGRTGGLVSVLGVQTGTLLHVVAAICGLSAALASSDTAMTAVQLGGAAYLVSLGALRLLRPTTTSLTEDERERPSRKSLFWQGLLVDALNPKTAIFFLAFLPQFVDTERGHVGTQIALLGLCFVVLAATTDGTCAVGAGWLRARLTQGSAALHRLDRVAGVALVGLGIAGALVGSHLG